jgi:hypothetical protein
MENFDCESKFFHFLFEDYFVSFFSSFFAAKFREMEAKLRDLDQSGILLKKDLKRQLLILETIVDGKIEENIDHLQKQQIKLEIEMNSFSQKFSALKKEIFELVGMASDCHERFSSPYIDKLV